MLVLSKTDTEGEQNNGNTKKPRNKICVGYAERTVDNTKCSSVCLHSVLLVQCISDRAE
jgi:hypothetical protein